MKKVPSRHFSRPPPSSPPLLLRNQALEQRGFLRGDGAILAEERDGHDVGVHDPEISLVRKLLGGGMHGGKAKGAFRYFAEGGEALTVHALCGAVAHFLQVGLGVGFRQRLFRGDFGIGDTLDAIVPLGAVQGVQVYAAAVGVVIGDVHAVALRDMDGERAGDKGEMQDASLLAYRHAGQVVRQRGFSGKELAHDRLLEAVHKIWMKEFRVGQHAYVQRPAVLEGHQMAAGAVAFVGERRDAVCKVRNGCEGGFVKGFAEGGYGQRHHFHILAEGQYGLIFIGRVPDGKKLHHGNLGAGPLGAQGQVDEIRGFGEKVHEHGIRRARRNLAAGQGIALIVFGNALRGKNVKQHGFLGLGGLRGEGVPAIHPGGHHVQQPFALQGQQMLAIHAVGRFLRPNQPLAGDQAVQRLIGQGSAVVGDHVQHIADILLSHTHKGAALEFLMPERKKDKVGVAELGQAHAQRLLVCVVQHHLKLGIKGQEQGNVRVGKVVHIGVVPGFVQGCDGYLARKRGQGQKQAEAGKQGHQETGRMLHGDSFLYIGILKGCIP